MCGSKNTTRMVYVRLLWLVLFLLHKTTKIIKLPKYAWRGSRGHKKLEAQLLHMCLARSLFINYKNCPYSQKMLWMDGMLRAQKTKCQPDGGSVSLSLLFYFFFLYASTHTDPASLPKISDLPFSCSLALALSFFFYTKLQRLLSC
jgi:hypothetical protein